MYPNLIYLFSPRYMGIGKNVLYCSIEAVVLDVVEVFLKMEIPGEFA